MAIVSFNAADFVGGENKAVFTIILNATCYLWGIRQELVQSKLQYPIRMPGVRYHRPNTRKSNNCLLFVAIFDSACPRILIVFTVQTNLKRVACQY